MCLGLAADGANVVAVDIDPEPLKSLEASTHAGVIVPVCADIADADAVRQLVHDVEARFGAVDVVINNAGPTQSSVRPYSNDNPVRYDEVDVETYRLFLDVHVIAPFVMARTVLPSMVERGWGRVITVTTSLSTMIRQGRLPYGPAKAANEAQMAVLAADVEGTGVSVNVVVPGGAAATRALHLMRPPETWGNLFAPEIMVPPVSWLCSDHSDGVNSMRFVASKWDPSVPVERNVAVAGAPIGWPGLQAVDPTTQLAGTP